MNKLFSIIIVLNTLIISIANSDEKLLSGNQFTFYSGIFALSDSGQRSPYLAVQHLDKELYRDTFLGTAQPITGIMVTPDFQGYIYTGFQLNHEINDKLKFTPSFSPGLYSRGKGKPLGHILEFKTELQISWETKNKNIFGLSFNHLSNAGIGDSNPGANNYMFNYIKTF